MTEPSGCLGRVLWVKFAEEFANDSFQWEDAFKRDDISYLCEAVGDGALDADELGVFLHIDKEDVSFDDANRTLGPDVHIHDPWLAMEMDFQKFAGSDSELTLRDVVRVFSKRYSIGLDGKSFERAFTALGAKPGDVQKYLRAKGGNVPRELTYVDLAQLFGTQIGTTGHFPRSFLLDHAGRQPDEYFFRQVIDTQALVNAVCYAAGR